LKPDRKVSVEEFEGEGRLRTREALIERLEASKEGWELVVEASMGS
jgi:hypothetical protein